MSDARKARIEAAFGAAADRYDDHAGIQRAVAATVADLAGQRRPGSGTHILEIGCGTGFLTREIGTRWPGAELVATDLAPAMIGRAALGGLVAGTFLPMDGERPWFEGEWFDLILSSLAFQWFDDLPGAIRRLVALLRPGGSLIFSTMGADSFSRWRAAHDAHGLPCGVPVYPSLADLRSMLEGFEDAFAFDEADMPIDCQGARGLVDHLKGIGAVVPTQGRSPLNIRELRSVMAAFDAQGGRDSYHVLFGRVTRPF